MKKIFLILLLVLISACSLNKKWDIKYMDIADELQPDNNISMELVEKTSDSLTVKFTNNNHEKFMYGDYFSIQVLIDEKWYIVPDTMMYHDIGYILNPNESVTKSYDISHFELPSGTYRIVISDLCAEFLVK